MEMHICFDNFTSIVCHKATSTLVHKKIRKGVYCRIAFNNENCKQPKCTLVGEWINKMWPIPTEFLLNTIGLYMSM